MFFKHVLVARASTLVSSNSSRLASPISHSLNNVSKFSKNLHISAPIHFSFQLS